MRSKTFGTKILNIVITDTADVYSYSKISNIRDTYGGLPYAKLITSNYRNTADYPSGRERMRYSLVHSIQYNTR